MVLCMRHFYQNLHKNEFGQRGNIFFSFIGIKISFCPGLELALKFQPDLGLVYYIEIYFQARARSTGPSNFEFLLKSKHKSDFITFVHFVTRIVYSVYTHTYTYTHIYIYIYIYIYIHIHTHSIILIYIYARL